MMLYDPKEPNIANMLFGAVSRVSPGDVPVLTSPRHEEDDELVAAADLRSGTGPLHHVGSVAQLRRNLDMFLNRAFRYTFGLSPGAWRRQGDRSIADVIERFFGNSAIQDHPARFRTYRYYSSMEREVGKQGFHARYDDRTNEHQSVDVPLSLGFEYAGDDSLVIPHGPDFWYYPDGTDSATGFVRQTHCEIAYRGDEYAMYRYREELAVCGVTSEFDQIRKRRLFPVQIGRSALSASNTIEWSNLQVLSVSWFGDETRDGRVVDAMVRELVFLLMPGTGKVAHMATNRSEINHPIRAFYPQPEAIPYWDWLKKRRF